MAKKKKNSGGSSTPGKSKGSNCQKSIIKTQHSKDARFYRRDPVNYAKAAHIINQEKGNLSNGSPWIKEILNN